MYEEDVVELGPELLSSLDRNREAFAAAKVLGQLARPQHESFVSLADVAFRLRLLMFFLPSDCKPPPAMYACLCAWASDDVNDACDFKDSYRGLFKNGRDGDVADELQMPGSGHEEVIEEVVHSEPSVIPDPSDEILADHIWASGVESLINGASVSIDDSPDCAVAEPALEAAEKDDIYLLQFSRNPEQFENSLSCGISLKSCRDALEEAGLPWNLPSVAKVFVHPSQYRQSLEFLERYDTRLRPYHVVVAASLQHLVDESLSGIPCRQGARIKKRVTLGAAQSGKRVKAHEEQSGGRKEADSDGEDATIGESSQTVLEMPMIVCEQRTFICCLPRFPYLRDATSVPQSTTEAHGGLNPRRIMAMSLSDN
jgi:hypothetical protein